MNVIAMNLQNMMAGYLKFILL